MSTLAFADNFVMIDRSRGRNVYHSIRYGDAMSHHSRGRNVYLGILCGCGDAVSAAAGDAMSTGVSSGAAVVLPIVIVKLRLLLLPERFGLAVLVQSELRRKREE